MAKLKQGIDLQPFVIDFKVDLAESDIASLSESIELSEENSKEVVVLFESIVNQKIKEIAESCEEHYRDQAAELLEHNTDEMSNAIEGFLDKVVDNWVKENNERIEESIKLDQNTEIVKGLLKVLGESYVEIPKARRDLVDDMAEEIKTLEAENAELDEQVYTLTMSIKGGQCQAHINELSKSLTESNKEKFESLIEDYNIDDVEVFKEKTSIIFKNFFEKKNDEDISVDESNNDSADDELNENDNEYSSPGKNKTLLGGDYGQRVLDAAKQRISRNNKN